MNPLLLFRLENQKLGIYYERFGPSDVQLFSHGIKLINV